MKKEEEKKKRRTGREVGGKSSAKILRWIWVEIALGHVANCLLN